MGLQNSVDIYVAEAYAGMMTSAFDAQSINSYALAGTDTVAWGDGVVYGTEPGTIRKAAAGDLLADFAGFVARNPFKENAVASGFAFGEGDEVPVARIGEMWVSPIDEVAPGTAVNLIIDNTDPALIGSLTVTPVANETVDISTVVRALSAAPADGGLMKLSILMK